MKNVNWWKWGVIAVIVLALMYWARSCGIKSVLKTVGTKKTVTKDSIVYRDTGRIVPYRIDVPIYIKGKDGKPYPVFDTLWGTQEIIVPTDTAAILSRYYETAHYQHIVDTGRWKITVDESITQNRIKNWTLKAVSSDTTTVNTVQLKPPKNFVLYFVASAMGNRHEPLGGAGVGMGLKTPKDRVFVVQWKTIKGNQPMIEATYLAPLRNPFKKRK